MTISLRLDPELADRLAAAAKMKGVSKSEVIRLCLMDYLDSEAAKPSAWELGKDLFGCYHSGRGDLAERSEEIAREVIRARSAQERRR